MAGLVHHMERCPPNVKLREFFAWWDVSGPFPIAIVRGSTNDTLQLELYAQGRKRLPDGSWIVVNQAEVVTNAQTAEKSAHGHDAAADCQPVRELFPNGGVKSVYLGNPKIEPPDVVAEAIRRLDVYDSIAKAHGLETGEKYPGICDRPHACDPDWESLPLTTSV